jgi:hypothetical protein
MCFLGVKQKHACNAVLYKKKAQGRSAKTLKGKKSRAKISLEHAKGGREQLTRIRMGCRAYY